MRPAVLLAAALAVLAAAGCGQKGGLYLRDSPPPGMKAPKPPVYTPVPYPAEPEAERSAPQK